jgi:hypothetical protein
MTIGPVGDAAFEPVYNCQDIEVPLRVKLCSVPVAGVGDRVGHVPIAVGRSGGVLPPWAAAPLELEPLPEVPPDPDECAPEPLPEVPPDPDECALLDPEPLPEPLLDEPLLVEPP